jgi:hypothetical protein
MAKGFSDRAEAVKPSPPAAEDIGRDRGAKGSMPTPDPEGEWGAGTIPQRDRPVPAPQPDASAGAPEGASLNTPP